jgi:hypothetical protein
MDYDVIQMLRSKTNKSQYVCRAVRAYTIKEEEFDISDVPTRQILAALHARNEISAQLAGCILAELSD